MIDSDESDDVHHVTMYEERMMRFQKKDSDDFDEENHVTIDEEGIMREF